MSDPQFPYLNKELWMKMKAESTYRVKGRLYAHGRPLDESAIDKEMGLSGETTSSDHPNDSSLVDNVHHHGNGGIPELNPGDRIRAVRPNDHDPQPGSDIIHAGPGYMIQSIPRSDQSDGFSSLVRRRPNFPRGDLALPKLNIGNNPPAAPLNREHPPGIIEAGPGYLIVSDPQSDRHDKLSSPVRHRPGPERREIASPPLHTDHFGDAGMQGRMNPDSPLFSPASPPYGNTNPCYSRASPVVSPAYSHTNSPVYSPASSPLYSPASPPHDPTSPCRSLGSPAYSPTSPFYGRASPDISMGNPACSPAYSPTSPCYSRASPVGSPTYSLTRAPVYSPANPPLYSPTSPTYRPGSPAYSLDGPMYSPASLAAPMDSPRFEGPPRHTPGSAPLEDASPTTSRTAHEFEGFAENTSFSLAMRPRQTEKLVDPVPEDLPNADPTHKDDPCGGKGSDSAAPKDDASYPSDHAKPPQNSPELLGEGLANLGDQEEELLDGGTYEFIVRD